MIITMTDILTFYGEMYGGDCKIPTAEFPLWERRAEFELARITGGRSAGTEDDRVKLCICEMAELLFTESRREGISSENNDGYSVTYEKGDIKRKLCEIAKTQLSSTDFLYRGVENDR